MSEIQRLIDRVDELEDAMGLTAEIPREIIPRELLAGIPIGKPMTLKTIAVLLARPFGDKHAMFNALYGNRLDCDQPEIKILDVYAQRAAA